MKIISSCHYMEIWKIHSQLYVPYNQWVALMTIMFAVILSFDVALVSEFTIIIITK